MNVEELVQDVILSLLGELPPVKKVEDLKTRIKAYKDYHKYFSSLENLLVRFSHSVSYIT